MTTLLGQQHDLSRQTDRDEEQLNEYFKGTKMKDILTQARAKIADPAHWTQRAIARDINGDKTTGDDPLACSFCAIGAVQAVTTEEQFTIACAALIRAAKALFGTYSISDVNDKRGHDAVLKCYAHAINEAAT